MGCAATVPSARAAALKEPMRIGHVDTNISAPAIVGYMRLLMCSVLTGHTLLFVHEIEIFVPVQLMPVCPVGGL